MKFQKLIPVLVTAACVASMPVPAHHSPSAYDMTRTVEAEGVVVETKIINPHFTMQVKVANKDGTTEVFNIHGGGKTLLKNTGVDLSEFKPGVKVKVAGNPRKADGHDLLVSNLLGPRGKEILLGVPGMLPKPRWSQVATGGYDANDVKGVVDPVAAKRGIFRKWSAVTYITDPDAMKRMAGGQGGPKLNEQGMGLMKQRMAARLKMEADGTLPDCYVMTMPTVATPLLSSVEFIDKGKMLEQRIELAGKSRMIYLQEPAKRPAADPMLGYSVGRWEGKTLVVTTTGIASNVEVSQVIPQSDKLVLTERFTPSEDGARLDYQLVNEDPVYLQEPQKTSLYWAWRPGTRVEPYRCVETKVAAKKVAAGR